jgi:hypothetical protein
MMMLKVISKLNMAVVIWLQRLVSRLPTFKKLKKAFPLRMLRTLCIRRKCLGKDLSNRAIPAKVNPIKNWAFG